MKNGPALLGGSVFIIGIIWIGVIRILKNAFES